MASRKVLTCRFPQPYAQCRLICFPWAGGGALFYANWGKLFSSNIEVHAVCLPGREGRYKEPNHSSLSAVLDEVVPAVAEVCKDAPFAFWGHSAGALLSYEVALRLKSQYNIEPVKMFVSGVSAPHSELRKAKTPDVSKKTDDEFIEFLVKLGGTPAEIVKDKEIMKMFLPALRADYLMLHDFSYDHPKDRGFLTCPLDILDGKDDRKHDLEGWKDITTGPHRIQMMNGGHFYLKEKENTDLIVQLISDWLSTVG